MRVVTALALIALCGCASVQYKPPGEVENLTPTSSFTMSLPPLSHAAVPIGSRVPVVGSTERDGKVYRVVRLPDQSAQFLNILINDDGTFQGSAISALDGARMGFSYLPDPPGVRLVAYGTTDATTMRPPHEVAPHAPSPSQAEASTHNGSNGVAAEWANVPCDIVVEAKRDQCLAEHERLGIDPNTTANDSMNAADQAEGVPSCGFAGNGYRPIVDLEGVDTSRYECDLSDCQAYAAQINTGQNAVGGAVAGALIGAAIGALIGDHGSYARYGAGVGAVQGGVGAAAGSVAAQATVVRNCMSGRGYRVLQ
jgi:hypothetical protein